jgi:hypothetical protein
VESLPELTIHQHYTLRHYFYGVAIISKSITKIVNGLVGALVGVEKGRGKGEGDLIA